MINHSEVKKALKILADNPGKMREAQKAYEARMAEIKAEEAKRIWSPLAIDNMRAEAAQHRNRVCKTLIDAMKSSLATVRDNNSFFDCPIDLDNPKLSNALRVLDVAGDKMSPSDQVNLVTQFRGDFASLRVLEAALNKAGKKWAAMSAHELQRPISDAAIQQMDEVLAFADYANAQGKYDLEMGRCWKHGEFAEAAARYGYDLDGEDDAYNLTLDVTMQMLNAKREDTMTEADPAKAAEAQAYLDAQRAKIKLAQAEIRQAKEHGLDVGKAFNKAMEQSNILDIAI